MNQDNNTMRTIKMLAETVAVQRHATKNERNMIDELKYGLSRKILIRAGLESANSGSQVRQPNHSATTIKGYKSPTNL